MVERLRQRLPAIAALALPVVAGIVCMALMDAPPRYMAANGLALALGLALLLGMRAPAGHRGERMLAAALLAVLFLPLLAGPSVNGITRWIALGPVSLHAGMIALPAIAVLAARDRDYAAPVLLTALLAALLQPDAALAFAVTLAAVGVHHAKRDWKLGLVAIAGFMGMMVATLRGELPAAPFVERVLVQYAMESPAAALGLFLALVAGFVAIVLAAPLERPARLALGGTLFGFSVMALMNNYPSALIGHGAAPIIGYGLALGLVRREQR